MKQRIQLITEENYQKPLSQYRLLYGRKGNDRNEPFCNIETNQTSAVARVKHLQTVLEHFQERFYVEYFLIYVKNMLKHQASVD